MGTIIDGWGWGKSVQTSSSSDWLLDKRIEEEKTFEELQRQEALIVKHIEKATNQKYVVVDGKGHYIPKTDANKLGLL